MLITLACIYIFGFIVSVHIAVGFIRKEIRKEEIPNDVFTWFIMCSILSAFWPIIISGLVIYVVFRLVSIWAPCIFKPFIWVLNSYLFLCDKIYSCCRSLILFIERVLFND
jgi:hypothetical protein